MSNLIRLQTKSQRDDEIFRREVEAEINMMIAGCVSDGRHERRPRSRAAEPSRGWVQLEMWPVSP